MPIRIQISMSLPLPIRVPDWHLRDSDPHADHTPSFARVGKSEFFFFTFSHSFVSLRCVYLSHQRKRCHNLKYGTLNSIPVLKFCGKKYSLSTFSYAWHWYRSRSGKMMYCTVGEQSIARLCQNLLNCRRNISAYRRPRKLRFFLIERSLAGEWF